MRSMRSLLLIPILPVLLASELRAQQAPPAPLDALRGGFDEVAGWVVKAAELVPAEKFNYRPTEGVRTVGEMVGHIADGNNYYCPRASGKRTDWVETVATSGADKAGMIGKLKESLELCRAAHATGANIGPLMANFGHVNLHYGNLVTYLRMLGITPPSS